MIALAVLFAILAIIFGLWGYGLAATVAWAGAKILFWIFVVLLIVAVIGDGWRGRNTVR